MDDNDPLLGAIVHADQQLQAATKALEAAAQQAREAGATWQQIGAAMGISKQAAAQRFARLKPRDEAGAAAVLEARLAAIAQQFFAALASGDPATAHSMMTYTTRRLLSQTRLTTMWASVVDECGEFEGVKRTALEQHATRAVLTFRLQHAAGEPVGQFSFNSAHKITGLVVYLDDSAELPW
ncbi:DUF3887 domain-containing protein [Canibacter oris]|uniref:DUF3887 domain-containing protein n=1 Tax=Canibacter oris TaxID=1365628 RepID=A0A840DED5_9MICO|nr:DUF3887 domain-containing protein [Canibacter oris]MBB4071424.1 hypothetical protein [Canibacter oris]